MTFKADPASLDAFAAVLEGLGGDVKAARGYLHKYLSYDYGDARMFANIANANNDTKKRPKAARFALSATQIAFDIGAPGRAHSRWEQLLPAVFRRACGC